MPMSSIKQPEEALEETSITRSTSKEDPSIPLKAGKFSATPQPVDPSVM